MRLRTPLLLRRPLMSSTANMRPWKHNEVLAYWDARYGITQASERVSAWAPTFKGSISRSQANAANQPIYLPHTGDNYLWLPGNAADSCNAPTKVILGNIRVDIDFQPLSFPVAFMLAQKTDGATQGFKVIWNNAANKPLLYIGDGAGLTSVTPVTAPGWADNTRHILRIDWEDGVGATFFYDGIQSGAQVVLAKTMVDSATVLQMGDASSDDVKLYRVTVTNGSSVTYYSVDFTQCSESVSIGGATFVQNGDTYTLAGSSGKYTQIVARPWVLFDAAAYYLSTGAITLDQPCGIISCGRQNAWSVGTYIYDGVSGANALGVSQTTATPKLSMNAGAAACENANLAVATKGFAGFMLNGASSFSVVNQNTEVTGDPGAGNPGGFVTGCDGAAANFGAWQETACALIDKSASAERVRQIIASMQREYA